MAGRTLTSEPKFFGSTGYQICLPMVLRELRYEEAIDYSPNFLGFVMRDKNNIKFTGVDSYVLDDNYGSHHKINKRVYEVFFTKKWE